MKRIINIILILIMSMFLVSCGETSGGGSVDSAGSMNSAGSEGSTGNADSTGSANDAAHAMDDPRDESGNRDNTPVVYTPTADGNETISNDYAVIDISNVSQGYCMAKYLGTNEKVKLQLASPDGIEYTYLLQGSDYQTFPLSGGSGDYKVRVLENVGGDNYAIALDDSFTANIENEFLPFLYPNLYVNFNADTKAVAKGSELAAGAQTDLEVIENIYTYVIQNVVYDDAKAESVEYGYIPDVDETLATNKGICMDYAALMVAMLRSQRIPTKLETGYSGEASHAWISTYVDEVGWVDGIIEFNGKTWQLMDPTLAANNDKSAVEKYIGDGQNYTLKYNY